MNILVTGGCGFIGTALIRALGHSRHHGFRVVDNLSVGTRSALCDVLPVDAITLAASAPVPGRAQLAEVDIRDAPAALELTREMDAIIHLAANTGVPNSMADPRADCEANVIGTFNYLEAARANGVRRFVFASSSAPLGACEPPIHEQLPPAPMSPYGASKLAGEGYCSAYFHAFGTETAALRFGNVYGPGSGKKSSVVAKFIRRAIAGQPLEVYGDGKQTRDFIYIDDIVAGLASALTADGVGGHVFQIATGREVTVDELLDHLLPILEQSGIGSVQVKRAPRRVGDMPRSFADTRKARKMLGWSAHIDLDEGLRRTVDWFTSGRAQMDLELAGGLQ